MEGGDTPTRGGATMLEGGDTQTGVGATSSTDGITQSECGATMEQDGVIQSEGGAVKAEVESASEAPVSEEEHPAEVQHNVIPPEFTAGNDVIMRELLATSVTKRRAQRNRVQDVGTLRADENLLSQDMFVSIEGNQFRRNGMGSFGTFLY